MSEQKIEQFWRPATPDDVARVMRGETVEARFRDSEDTSWHLRQLNGWSTKVFICDQDDWWQQCQVYDQPEWFANKPDPGEGWRLLEKFPPEPKLKTDEAWQSIAQYWRIVSDDNGVQQDATWYRRRIANSPTSSDSSRSRDTIPSGWRLLGKDEERLASDAYWSQGCQDWIIIGDDRVAAANMPPREYAIRRLGSFDLVAGFNYTLPSGKVVQVTAKGFEVL